MNDYGVLYYDSEVEGASGNVYASGVATKQGLSQNVFFHHGSTPSNYNNWASFEQGAFNFKKKIYTGESAYDKIAFTTTDVATSETYFYDKLTIGIDNFAEPYSGDGFTLRTYMDWYEVEITVVDSDGPSTRQFEKTKEMADEFFVFPFDGIQSVLFKFKKVETNHFVKVISVGLGGSRIISDEVLVEEPQFDYYFSLMSDELPLDTLSFKVFGDDSNFNFVTGSKITDHNTGQIFYVSTATKNIDNTITVNCYDALVKRDVQFNGMMRVNTAVKDPDTVKLFFGDLPHEFDMFNTGGFNDRNWAGTITDDVTCREAIRMWLQGCTLALRKVGENFVIVSPFNDQIQNVEFDESDIVSIDFEELEPYTRLHFSKHKFTVDKTNGKQEAFRDNVERGNETQMLSYGEPYNSVEEFYVSATSGDEETLTPVDQTKFVVSERAAYYMKAKNLEYSQEIVIKGYPYKTSYTSIDYYPNTSSQFNENELLISDCSVSLNVNNQFYRDRLQFFSKFTTVINLKTMYSADAGLRAKVSVDGRTYEGFVTHMVDRKNGVYEHEILAYEVTENVA